MIINHCSASSSEFGTPRINQKSMHMPSGKNHPKVYICKLPSQLSQFANRCQLDDALLGLKSVPDVRHRLDIVAVEAQMVAERIDAHRVTPRADGCHDAMARDGLVGSRCEKPQDAVFDNRQPQRALPNFG